MEFFDRISNRISYQTVQRVSVVFFCVICLTQSFAIRPKELYQLDGEYDLMGGGQPQNDGDIYLRNTRGGGAYNNYYLRRRLDKFRKRGQFDALIAKLESLSGGDLDDVRVAPVRFGPGGKKR